MGFNSGFKGLMASLWYSRKKHMQHLPGQTIVLKCCVRGFADCSKNTSSAVYAQSRNNNNMRRNWIYSFFFHISGNRNWPMRNSINCKPPDIARILNSKNFSYSVMWHMWGKRWILTNIYNEILSRRWTCHMENLVLELWQYLTLRWLMSYIYGAPILDVSRSHTTTQHSR